METKKLTGWNWFWIVFAGLAVIGMFSNNSSTGTTPTVKTKSEWCRTHASDEWSGEMDSTTKRYLSECV